jgi:3-ketosteroid 9alpha-monooxygenase subunit B
VSPGAPLVRLRVVDVVRETDNARSLVLTPEADESIPEYSPGQFLTFRLPAPDGGTLARSYSLSSAPSSGELAVTVKQVRGGPGSTWMCERVRVGDVLEALRPAGTFTPRDLDDDLLLLAAGSGITPIMSIIQAGLESGHGRLMLVYANVDESAVIFATRLAELARRHPGRLVVVHWLESLQGLPDPDGLAALLRPYHEREAFVCGPSAFMAAARAALAAAGTPTSRVRVEEFVSLAGDPFTLPEVDDDGDSSTAMVEVELDGETRRLTWPRSRSLLDVLLSAGMAAPFSCREGACSACACVLVEGQVDLERNEVLDDADLADGLILACQARPVSDDLRVTYDA